MQHLEEGTIHAWIDGALDAEESARVEQHLAECAECASAVAEARGLVAGASRILAALDDVPSGVVPRSNGALGGGGGASGSSTPRRPGSVWTFLHLTPARAAAAAFLIVAAGTALVMRQASEVTHRSVYSMAARPGGTAAKTVVPATPLPAPRSADSSAAVDAAGPRRGTPAQVPGAGVGRAREVLPQPAPPPLAAPARKDFEEKRTLPHAQAAATANSSALSDSVARARTVAAAPDRPKAALNQVVVTSVVGGVAPSAAPSAARSLAATRRLVNYAGCYSVAARGDSASPLPKLLSLDSARFGRALADQLSSTVQLFAVSDRTTNGGHPIDTASWQPLLDGVRISFGRTPINLRLGTDSTLSAAGVAGRGYGMTLQRVDCPRR